MVKQSGIVVPSRRLQLRRSRVPLVRASTVSDAAHDVALRSGEGQIKTEKGHGDRMQYTKRAGSVGIGRGRGGQSTQGVHQNNWASIGIMSKQRRCRPPPGEGDEGGGRCWGSDRQINITENDARWVFGDKMLLQKESGTTDHMRM